MQITLEIIEDLWTYDLEKYNAQKTVEAQNAATFAARRKEAKPPDFVPLTLEQYVIAQTVTKKEAEIIAAQGAEHDAAILAATPADKARIVKILTQPEAIKDTIRAQMDAIHEA